MDAITSFRRSLASIDLEYPPPAAAGDKVAASKALRGNSQSFALEAVNSFASGTPLALFLTMPVGVTLGAVKLARGMGNHAMADDPARLEGEKRRMASGIKQIVCALTALVPGLGNVVNGAAAVIDGAQLINSALPTPPL